MSMSMKPDDLRKLAYLIESGIMGDVTILGNVFVYPQTREQAIQVLRAWQDSPLCKDPSERTSGDTVTIETTVGDDLTFYGSIVRSQVCKRVKVGTRMVEKPDPNAPKVTVEEDVYEYTCPPMMSEIMRNDGLYRPQRIP